MPIHVKMDDPAYGGHEIGKRTLNLIIQWLRRSPIARESEWADVSPLLKYISGAVAPRLKAPKGPYQASYSKIRKNDVHDNHVCHLLGNDNQSFLGPGKCFNGCSIVLYYRNHIIVFSSSHVPKGRDCPMLILAEVCNVSWKTFDSREKQGSGFSCKNQLPGNII